MSKRGRSAPTPSQRGTQKRVVPNSPELLSHHGSSGAKVKKVTEVVGGPG